MPEFEYVFDYKQNNQLRTSFNNLAKLCFSIDFEKWYKSGFWDNSYICHSIASNKEIISNISASKLNLIINNRKISAIQIGTVMTHPDYRMSGLAKTLMNKVLDHYKQSADLIYLFPNDTVMNFYPKFGFALWNDFKYSAAVKNISCSDKKISKMNIDNKDHLKQLEKLVRNRIPLSTRFDCTNATSVFMWHCLNVFQDKTYIIEPDKTVVIFEEKNGVIELYDIVSSHQVNLLDILSIISRNDNLRINFNFTPDFADFDRNRLKMVRNENMFVRPANYLTGQLFAHPVTAHT